MTEQDRKLIEKAKAAVCKRFPEMLDAEPTLSVERGPARAGQARPSLYVVTFEKDVPLEQGGRLRRIVRITLDQAGGIVKLSTAK